MTDWAVVIQPAYDAWAETTPDDDDGSLRRDAVLLWLLDRYDGLPEGMNWNPDGHCYEVEVQEAGVVIECQAYAFEVPPQFVVQYIRDAPTEGG